MTDRNDNLPKRFGDPGMPSVEDVWLSEVAYRARAMSAARVHFEEAERKAHECMRQALRAKVPPAEVGLAFAAPFSEAITPKYDDAHRAMIRESLARAVDPLLAELKKIDDLQNPKEA